MNCNPRSIFRFEGWVSLHSRTGLLLHQDTAAAAENKWGLITQCRRPTPINYTYTPAATVGASAYTSPHVSPPLASDPMEVTIPPSPSKNVYKDPDDGRQRFLLELEFIQCLANPTYIHYLAQNRYFEDEAFIGYLKYLQYWQRPEYLKFIMYPHCLFFLELLQNANFRNAMAHPANKELAHRQQFYFWKNYRNNRLKHILPKPLPEASATVTPTPPALPPTTITAAASTIPSPPPQVPSPMQYGSSFAKNDPRNSGVEKRKRK